jgi:hypothetical protein
MAERFRIDLGYPSLFGSLSYDGTGITDGVVVYDIFTKQLFYTGSYGPSGDIIVSGSILTGSLLKDATANLNVITFTRGNNTQFTVTIDTGSTPTFDNYWKLIDNNIINSGSLNVIVSSSLTIVQTSSNDDIFIIKKQGNDTRLKVNSQGVFTLMPTGSFPTAVTGGIIYKDNEYYFGFQ